MTGVQKSFGGVHALKGVDLEVQAGEIHGLLGENGSGKSTLIKVLNGFNRPDAGELYVDGEQVDLPLAPGRFQELGLSFVHQDLGLIRELTVLENLRLVSLGSARGPSINWRRERATARELFDEYGLGHLDLDAPLTAISETDAALLAIVRAVEGIGGGRGLLVLDEPTVFLPREGVNRLFELVRDVASRGVSVLFVSHDLDEVLELTDSFTVLRDGLVHGSARTADTDKESLIEMIIGRQLAEAKPLRERGDRSVEPKVQARVNDLSGPRLRGVSFDLHRGEILGVTGLMGSGFEDIPYSLFGAKPVRSGTLNHGDEEVRLASFSPGEALKSGIALVPADRQRDGALQEVTVLDNLMMQVMSDYRPWRLNNRAMEVRARELLDEFDVRPRDPDALFGALSGGNQQKVLLAKWLESDPGLLLLHEPTQGVDVGAREQVFSLLGQAASDGLAVMCASSDAEQLAQVCDRVLVVARGEITKELVGSDLTKEEISKQVLQSVTLSEMENFQEALV